MKYIKYTNVDFLTRIPLTKARAINGPDVPSVQGLEFGFALESQFPTDSPIYYGKVPDEADTRVEGVLEVLSLKAYKAAEKKEMSDRFDAQKYAKLSQVEALFKQESKEVRSGYSDFESSTWARQEAEARAYLEDSKSKVPLLKALALDKEDLSVLATSIVSKSDQYFAKVGNAIRKKRMLEKEINKAKDIEDLQIIDVM